MPKRNHPNSPEAAKPAVGAFHEIIKPTLVLVLICAVVAGLLAFTYNVAGIAALEAAGLSAKQLEEVLPVTLPGGTKLSAVKTSYESPNFIGAYQDNSGKGCAVYVKVHGYGGDIKILVGIDPNGTIAGLQVIENAETPGLGTRALELDYLIQYVGETAPVALKADGGTIDAVAGSTISSKAVAHGVTIAFEVYEEIKGDLS